MLTQRLGLKIPAFPRKDYSTAGAKGPRLPDERLFYVETLVTRSSKFAAAGRKADLMGPPFSLARNIWPPLLQAFPGMPVITGSCFSTAPWLLAHKLLATARGVTLILAFRSCLWLRVQQELHLYAIEPNDMM